MPISAEEPFEDVSRVFLEDSKPSRFFYEQLRAGSLSAYFPEAEALSTCEQSPFWHPEGNAFVHTMAVLDAGAELRKQAMHPLAFMLACLMHDYGKPLTTKRLPDGSLTCRGHASAGRSPAQAGLRRLNVPVKVAELVVNHVVLHLAPLEYYEKNASVGETRALLASSLCPEDLLLLSRADGLGSGRGFPPEKDAFWAERYCDYLANRKTAR